MCVYGKGSLSRIDLALGNIIGLSDHSPLLFELAVGLGGRQPGWKIHPYWLLQIGINDRILDQLRIFLEAHGDLPTDGNCWDALKAYLRGALRSTIANIRKTNRQEEEELSEMCASGDRI